MNDKIIFITCTGTELIEVSSLVSLQGKLKDKTKEQLGKLKNQIFKHGFSFPIFIWQDRGKNYTLDGHGRDFVCKELIKEGYLFQRGQGKPSTKIPADFIDAKDRIEAKEKLLALNSSFGKITEEGLYEFLNEPDFQIDFDSVKTDLELPGVDLERFEEGWMDDETSQKTAESLQPYNQSHVLISFTPIHLLKIQDLIEKLKNIDGIEIEQSTN